MGSTPTRQTSTPAQLVAQRLFAGIAALITQAHPKAVAARTVQDASSALLRDRSGTRDAQPGSQPNTSPSSTACAARLGLMARMAGMGGRSWGRQAVTGRPVSAGLVAMVRTGQTGTAASGR